MTSSTCNNKRRPKLPPGCDRAKSSSVKPRASSNATANASPIASVAVVLAVGREIQRAASLGTLTSSTTSAARPSVDCGLPVIAIKPTCSALDDRQQRDQFGGLAGVRQCQQHIRRRDHADVAMTGLRGMQKKRRGSGACKRRRDLVADMAGLAHAGDDNPAVARINKPASRDEVLADVILQRRNCRRLDREHFAGAGDHIGGVQFGSSWRA